MLCEMKRWLLLLALEIKRSAFAAVFERQALWVDAYFWAGQLAMQNDDEDSLDKGMKRRRRKVYLDGRKTLPDQRGRSN